MKRIAFVDWGVGGLGVVERCLRAQPDLSFVYVSDTGAVPYGKQSARQLSDRLVTIAERLSATYGITNLAIACNAASTVAPRVSVRVPRLRVHDIITHGVNSVLAARVKHVGIVAGARTVRSGAYRSLLNARDVRVSQRIAQPLSAHIEAGRQGSEIFLRDVQNIVRPLKKCDALLLACTHYPAARDVFAKVLPGMLILDPAARFSAHLLEFSLATQGEQIYVTSGDPRAMAQSAKLAWNAKLHAQRW